MNILILNPNEHNETLLMHASFMHASEVRPFGIKISSASVAENARKLKEVERKLQTEKIFFVIHRI